MAKAKDKYMFDYLNADKFFKNYCPDVKNYKHKKRGFSGKGQEIGFTPEDIKLIKRGIKELSIDLTKMLINKSK